MADPGAGELQASHNKEAQSPAACLVMRTTSHPCYSLSRGLGVLGGSAQAEGPWWGWQGLFGTLTNPYVRWYCAGPVIQCPFSVPVRQCCHLESCGSPNPSLGTHGQSSRMVSEKGLGSLNGPLVLPGDCRRWSCRGTAAAVALAQEVGRKYPPLRKHQESQENDGQTGSWCLAIIRRWPSPPVSRRQEITVCCLSKAAEPQPSWCFLKAVLARDTWYQKNACPENLPIPHPKHNSHNRALEHHV